MQRNKRFCSLHSPKPEKHLVVCRYSDSVLARKVQGHEQVRNKLQKHFSFKNPYHIYLWKDQGLRNSGFDLKEQRKS